MSKRTTKRLWVVIIEFLGGPADGKRTEVGVEGPDPVRAFISAQDDGRVPDRMRIQNHVYNADMMSLYEVTVGDGAIGRIRYIFEGMRL